MFHFNARSVSNVLIIVYMYIQYIGIISVVYELEMCGIGFQHPLSLPFPFPYSQRCSCEQIKLPAVSFTIYTSCHFQYTSNCNMFLK